MHTGDITQFVQRPEGRESGLRRGSAPGRYSAFAMMQYPVAANQTVVPPKMLLLRVELEGLATALGARHARRPTGVARGVSCLSRPGKSRSRAPGAGNSATACD